MASTAAAGVNSADWTDPADAGVSAATVAKRGRVTLAGMVAVRTRAVARFAALFETFLESERRQLPLWLPVALGAGVVAWFLLPTPETWLGFGAGALAVALAGAIVPGWCGRVMLAGGLLAALGLGIAWGRAEQVAAPRLTHELRAVWLDATVTAREDREGRGQWRLYLHADDPALPPTIRVSFRKLPDPRLTPGARLRARVSLRPPQGPSVPGGYDFARRAWFEGVGATGYSLGDPVLIAPAPPPSGARAWLEDVRTRITHRLQTRVGGAEGAMAAAFVTGDVGGNPEVVRQEMTDAGLAHIISISGLHIAVVIAVTMLVVRRTLTAVPWIALRWPVKAIAAGTAALVGIAYTLLAGAQIPTVRSVAAALLVLAGVAAGRTAFSLRGIATGAFLILLFRPEAVIGPSFQLSFAAVTSLVAAFQSAPGRWLSRRREEDGWFARTARHGAVLVASGCVAEAALAPIALYHFNREGLYGMIANLVAIPWSELVIMPALMLTLAMDALGVAAPAVWLLKHSMALLLQIAHFVAHWPGAVMRMPTMPLAAYALFVGGGLWLCLWAGRARLIGLGPIAAGALIASAATAPDLIVSGDGRHLGVLRPDGALAMLRPHAGAFIRSMWGDSVGTAETLPLDEVASASCGDDACVLLLKRGGRLWRVLATRSKRIVPRDAMEPQCAAADIVVSERRLPRWCAPAAFKLDARTLAASGAVALWLGEKRIARATDGQGAHPWASPAGGAVVKRTRYAGATDRMDEHRRVP